MNPQRTAQHLRRRGYVAMPWRNGGGVTFEIAREPQTGTDFDWRLSIEAPQRRIRRGRSMRGPLLV